MKLNYFRELQRYTKETIGSKLNISIDDTIEILRKLKSYGIVKTVRDNNEEVEEESLKELIDISDIEQGERKQYFVFDYVGIVMVSNNVFICYPKYIMSNNIPLNEMKTILRVLEKYDSKKEIVNWASGYEENSDFNLLSIMLYILNDYFENGTYINQKEIIEINGDGEIDWDKTINETYPLINNNKPYYLEMFTSKSVEDDRNYFQKLHLCIVTECCKKMMDTELLNLFNMEEVYLYDGKLEEFGDKEYILYRILGELNTQFDDRKKLLLKTMYAYVSQEKLNNEGFGLSLYGTNSFNLIWEKVCASAFGNVLNKSISDLPLPIAASYENMKSKKLIGLIDKPLWREFEANEVKGCKAKKTLTPDLISIYKVGSEYCFGIFDAKYYNMGFHTNGLRVYGQPGVADVTKQYLYQLAYQDFIETHGYYYTQNAFLFPSEYDKVNILGEVEMSMLYNLKERKLKNIIAIKLPAEKMYKLYIDDNQIEDIDKFLHYVSCKENTSTFTNRVVDYLAHDNQSNSMENRKVTYPEIIKHEIGAKIIYNIIYRAAKKCLYNFSDEKTLEIEEISAELLDDNQLIFSQLAEVSLEIENEIKDMSSNNNFNKKHFSDRVYQLIKSKNYIEKIVGSDLFEELKTEIFNFAENLYR